MTLDQVRNNRRNLLVMWFDYKKAFDYVPHDWVTKALQLAKVAPKIINAISQVMKVWATKITLKGENETIETRPSRHKDVVKTFYFWSKTS